MILFSKFLYNHILFIPPIFISLRPHFNLCLCLLVLFVGCAVFAAYDEVELIPEEDLEEPGHQETAAADAYVSEGKSHRSFMLTMIDPK